MSIVRRSLDSCAQYHSRCPNETTKLVTPSSNLRVTETKVTYFMLKGNRVEGQPKSRRGVSPSGIHRSK